MGRVPRPPSFNSCRFGHGKTGDNNGNKELEKYLRAMKYGNRRTISRNNLAGRRRRFVDFATRRGPGREEIVRDFIREYNETHRPTQSSFQAALILAHHASIAGNPISDLLQESEIQQVHLTNDITLINTRSQTLQINGGEQVPPVEILSNSQIVQHSTAMRTFTISIDVQRLESLHQMPANIQLQQLNLIQQDQQNQPGQEINQLQQINLLHLYQDFGNQQQLQAAPTDQELENDEQIVEEQLDNILLPIETEQHLQNFQQLTSFEHFSTEIEGNTQLQDVLQGHQDTEIHQLLKSDHLVDKKVLKQDPVEKQSLPQCLRQETSTQTTSSNVEDVYRNDGEGCSTSTFNYINPDLSPVTVPDKKWLKYIVEQMTKEELVLLYIIAELNQLFDTAPEMMDSTNLPNPEVARQKFLSMTYGDFWDVSHLMDLVKLVPVVKKLLVQLKEKNINILSTPDRQILQLLRSWELINRYAN